ncbi:MAG TPA: 2-phospho-L-lactate transferase [Candidatus Limnocylindrales bacterium]|nr:2-phospho-L-lactate transferase [Candidatus Limnocylindrales bacterium]
MTDRTRVTVIAGGFGGARMAHGFALLPDDVELTVVINTADDTELHGLRISPDLDTVMYTLAGVANNETGWGVANETWSAAEMLAGYGEPTWFRLGDRDLATHVVRTARLHAGERLTDVTRDLAAALGVTATLLPMTDDEVRTKILTPDGWLDFQDYFVRRHHSDPVEDVRFDGMETARATAEALEAITEADLIVIAPSNPFVSVGPVFALPGIRDAMLAADAPILAVSPIVGGAALRGPAANMMRTLGAGAAATAAGIARVYATRYPGVVDTLVIDDADAADAEAVAATGIAYAAAGIVIADEHSRRRLALNLLRLSLQP